jgi:hypothetical protein
MVKNKEPAIAGGLFLHGMLQMVEMALIEPLWLKPLQAMHLLDLIIRKNYF